MSGDFELEPGPFRTTTSTKITGGAHTSIIGHNDHITTGTRPAMSDDEAVLAGFGKKQQLKRRFKYVSSVGLTSTLVIAWLGLLNNLQIGLANGGPAGLIWGFVGASAGTLLQALVMGEMSSMIPLAGGAFNWVSILAPPSHRRFASYVAGWFTIVTYQVDVVSASYSVGIVVQGLVIFAVPSYEPQLWHATLISWAVVLYGFFINTYLGRVLPQIESFQLIFFFLGYAGVLIPVAYLCPHRSAADVFLTFQNINGWDSPGASFLVGWIASVGVYVGIEGVDHIAEEVQSATTVVPFAMWFSTLLNAVMGFGLLITYLFATQDFVAVTQTKTGFAFIEILNEGLGSTHGVIAIVAITLVINIMSISSIIATTSRALWAFSREKGLPFSNFTVKVDPKTRLPFNAICVTIAIDMVISLISVGSTTAFVAFVSLNVAAYYTTFLIAAGYILHKRVTTPTRDIPWGPFRLGKFGIPITIIAIAYTIVTTLFSFFPTALPVTPQNMNYSIVVYGAAIILMLGFWVVHGRRVYVGPIWELDGEYVRRK